MKRIISTCFIFWMGFVQIVNAQITKQRVNPPHQNTPEQIGKPYLILISADGFRYDYATKYNAKHLLKLAGNGVKATSMIPVFPSSTTPNHYSLVTGLYPVHTGIIANNFYCPKFKKMKDSDSRWYVKDPIWISAEKQGMVTGSINFVASNHKIDGVETSYYYKYNKKNATSIKGRVEIIKKWLSLPEKVRPHLIALYNNETDHAGHRHGPDSQEVKKAVGLMDSLVAQLQIVIKETGLPVNVVFVSDHGMTPIDQQHHLSIPLSIDTTKFVIVDQRALVSLHAKSSKDIMPMYNKLNAENSPRYSVYLQKDLPKDLHFEMKEDKFNRIGDIILIAKWPNLFTRTPAGAHGFNPYIVKDVHAAFFAWGPAFKQGLTIRAFPNVEVYGMMMNVLGLRPEPNDGTGLLINDILN